MICMSPRRKYSSRLELELQVLQVSQLLSMTVKEMAMLACLRDSIWMSSS